VLRGSSQNPDVFFQSRERTNPWYDAFPQIVQDAMDRFGELTGRHYRLFDYVGAADAERVMMLMGSGAETAHETVEHLTAQGEKVGVLKVRLYRPFSPAAMLDALPASAKAIAVLDRCKEPGADGEPLYKDVVTALAQAAADGTRAMQKVIGGRYGLASKEFTPGMVKAVFDELAQATPRRQFTIGIHDDVTQLSLPWDEGFRTDASRRLQHAVFWGLGSDGTVSANKNSIKILGEETDLQAQGYFVYDSKKSGAVTVSHLRFGQVPIRSTYLVEAGMAGFVACHQPMFVERYDLLEHAAANGVFLLNTPEPPDQVWDTLPQKLRAQILEKRLQLWVIDAYAVAAEAGMGRRINTIMQTCFFAISGILPKDEAIAAIKHAVDKTYGRKSKRLVELNYKAIDTTLAKLHHVTPSPACGRGVGGEGSLGAAAGFPFPGPERTTSQSTKPASGQVAGYLPRAGEGDRRLRPRPHPAGLPRQGRSPAGVAVSGGWHLSARHRAIREAQHRTGNSGMGAPTSAPSAASACSSARIPPSVRDCLQCRGRGRCSADPSSMRRRRARIFPPAPTSAIRSRRKTAPDAATASRPARSTTSQTSADAR
jgi:Pyruvate/2-oxoacid:ferredoxin oxidoreductase gamma subunit